MQNFVKPQTADTANCDIFPNQFNLYPHHQLTDFYRPVCGIKLP